MRSLVRAWLAAVIVAVALSASAAAWVALDHRPDWVMAVWVARESDSREAAQSGERHDADEIAAYVRRTQPDVSIAVSGEHEYGGRRRYRFERTLTLRATRDEPLSAIHAGTARWKPSGTEATVPQRALLASDCVFGFVLIAMLFGLGTLEPPGQSDAGPRAMQPGVVVLHGVTIGMLGAAAIVTGGHAYPANAVAAGLAVLPLLVWFVSVRSAG